VTNAPSDKAFTFSVVPKFSIAMSMAPVPSKSTPFIALAVANFVALEAFPDRVADIVPAMKLPLPSRATTVFTVLALVAFTAHEVEAEPLKLAPVRYDPADNVFGVLAVMVMLPPPLNDTPLMVLAFANTVADAALPENEEPVIVPLVIMLPCT
jgi:hypothetical protein